MTESLPVPPSGRSRDVRVAFLARLTLPTLFTVAVLYAAGVPAWLLAGGAAGLLGLAWRRDARRSQKTIFAVPGDARVLRTAEERAAYQRAVGVSRRVRRTWPGLPGMIDPVLADRSLTHALDDLATLLVRRQELRRLRAGLSGVPQQAVPDDSPALAALDAQREHAERLWLETAEQANRILRSIDAAALAGETFLHEQRISDTARRAERALSRLTVGAPPAESAPELADRTAAVLAAYRELEKLG
ncbi:hypothetical protein [Paractinoplanes rishiriensis]|uniref:hypothetical protein n=1 Tax=Paractinoplanes rishiriensis TaxID=1050105 RepID=UPI001EF211B9|nr:hypothetical protein [Actinoplanes rishiriensis]